MSAAVKKLGPESLAQTQPSVELRPISKQIPQKKNYYEYTGSYNDLLQRHGQGRLVHVIEKLTNDTSVSTKVVIEGTWENDVLHGHARIEMDGVVVYDGNWDKGFMTMKPNQNSTGPNRKVIVNSKQLTAPTQSSTAEECEVSNLNTHLLELLWLEGANQCYQVLDNEKSPVEAEKKSSKDANVKEAIDEKETVHNPSGPETFSQFLGLVFAWFVASVIYSLVMQGT